MIDWRLLFLRFMKVPPEPTPPPGEGVRIFRAGRNYFRWRLAVWGVRQIGALLGLVAGLVFLGAIGLPPIVERILLPLEIIGWVGFFLQLPFSLAAARLDFELRWYIVTDRSLRIREGILSVREKTMTFANIQNVSVRQGPLQRLLGLSDVEVRSAGGGGGGRHEEEHEEGGEPVHVGRFRGVDDAEAIRDLLLAGVRRQRDAGLGDPDDARPTAGEATSEPSGLAALADAARELRREAEALRRASA
jgi:membrane protein YdbS with pleckstrin-like domain